MGDFDPVSWEIIEAATGAPAVEINEYVERMREDLRSEDPYTAVKTIHDALSEDLDGNRSVPELGEVFITAYLLEKQGIITPDDSETRDTYQSVVDRRPSCERLQKLFWEYEWTLWWIGVQTGVHASLVSYWLYEDEIPLMERNFTPDSLAMIEVHRDAEND